MKVILHIGRHKTGTTSLQHFLSDNSQALQERCGISYPPSVGMPGHHVIAWKLIGKRFSNFLKRIGASDVDAATEIAQMADQARAQGARCLLLSSEVFAQIDQYDPARLARALQGHEVRVIAYVRRQDRYLEARYGEKVRQARLTEEFPDFCRRFIDSGLVDYHAYFGRWAGIFGKQNLLLRVYDRSRLAGGDVRNDFCQALGIPAEGLKFEAGERNLSLDFRTLQFLKRFNLMEHDQQQRRELLRWLESSRSGKAHSSLLNVDERRALLAQFRESNIRFAAEFLRAQDPFELGEAELAAEEQLDRHFSERDFLEILATVPPRLYSVTHE